MENVDEIPFLVRAACVLHNFCLLVDDGSIDEFLEDHDDDDGDCELPVDIPRPQAVVKRNQMVIFLNH